MVFFGWVFKEDVKEELANGFSNQSLVNLWFCDVKFIFIVVIR
ncbi:hypothetical protein [Campylobacter jejuni]|nr:hypothetical protein [Campylobacter jejuni]